MQLSITTNFPEVQARLDALQRDVASRALSSAVNKTLAQARTQMAREIVSEFAVRSDYVKQRLRIRQARAQSGRFSIEASLIGGGGKGRAANVIAFVEKLVTLSEAKKRAKAGTQNQLFVKIKRKGGKKPIKGAFIGNKGRTVFVRTGKARLPIEPVRTIDIAQMFNTQRINQKVLQAIRDRFPAILERETRFYVDRFNRSGK